MRTNVRSYVATAALLALAGCGGGSSGGTTKAAASTAPASKGATAATTSGATAAGNRFSGSVAATTSAISGSIASTTNAVNGSIAATTSAVLPAGTAFPGTIAATSTTSTAKGTIPGGTTGTTAGAGATSGLASTISGFAAPPTLKGTIPADPDTNFMGTLFFSGTRMEPGTNVLVGFGGLTVAVLSGTVYSSETLGASCYFLTAGDYTFTLLSATGIQSNAITVTVKAPAANGSWMTDPPKVSMMFPPSFDTSFVGTVWIMGEHFLPGATLLCTRPGYPDGTFPLNFVNDRSVYWETATPLAGDMTLSVVNPTTLASTPISAHVTDVTATATSNVPGSVSPVGPAPKVLLAPTSCLSPFLGSEKIYGTSFQPGASVVVVDSTGSATTTPALFVSSDEIWWELVYPVAGTYQVMVTNPDGQSTKAFTFTVN